MALLDREHILDAHDMATEVVEVPEWGGSVMVRGFTGTERDAFEESVLVGRGRNRRVDIRNIRAKFLVATIVGEDGNPLFTRGDIEALGRKSAKALDRIFDVAQRLSGMTTEDFEDLGKGFGSGPNDGSTSP